MDRIDVLTTEYLDGALGDAGADELAGLLEADAAARARFVALYADHRVLASQLAPDPEGAFARRVLAAIARDEDGFARSVMEDLAKTSASRLRAVTSWAGSRRRVVAAVLAAAAAVLLVTGWLVFNGGPASPAEEPEAARVAGVVGGAAVVRAGASVLPKAGLALRAGDVLRIPAGASLAFRYADGTRVDAEAGSELALEAMAGEYGGAAKRVSLRAGALGASVAPQPAGRPMTFATPHAEAQVLGTRLALAAGVADTRLEVTEGRVRLTRGADRASVEVAEGSFAIASPGAPMAAQPMDLVVKVLTPSVPDRFATRVGRLAEGSLMYSDRGYEITRMPERLRGHAAILLPNAEKDWTADEYLAFRVNRPVDLFIGYDSRAFEGGGARLPSWMSGFRDTGMRIFSRTAGDSTYHVYAKAYPAGRVVLGGNHAGGDTGSRENYLVIVAPKGAVADAPARGAEDEHR
jgi:ferric-dicitrate binding protein FerR (iron transport regulator)